MNIPCQDCVVMAVCNSKMKTKESVKGSHGFDLYRKCSNLSTYIDKHYKKQVKKNVWEIPLTSVYDFFLGKSDEQFFITDISSL